MSFSCHIVDIANAISNISISGVTVKDKDEVVASWLEQPNVLYPLPEAWINDFGVRFDAITRGAAAPSTVNYRLTYRFLGTQVGDLSTFPQGYSNVVDKLVLIVNAFMTLDSPYSGGMDLKIDSVSIGPRIDPAGNNYFGADISLLIEEQQN